MSFLNWITGTLGYIAILIALALLSGCASGHNYGGALLLGIFLPDPNRLTAEDREIMAREQAEADAAERREVGR